MAFFTIPGTVPDDIQVLLWWYLFVGCVTLTFFLIKRRHR